MKKHLAIFAIIIEMAALCTASAAPLQWVCNWPEAKAQTFSLYHGETAVFEPTFRINGAVATNIEISAVWYQTNGMGSAWWPLDNATFHPTNDVGAASYRFFVEGQGPSAEGQGLIYRANGTLRMLDSPGFSPNSVPIPPQVLDFSTVTVANAPWPDEIDTAVQRAAGALQTDIAAASASATNYTDKATNAVAAALQADIAAASSSATNYTDSATTAVAAALQTDIAAAADAATNYTDNAVANAPHVPTSRKVNNKALATDIEIDQNDIFPASSTNRYIGVQGNAGRYIRMLAQTISGIIAGGYKVCASTLNDNNETTYMYDAVAVKRNGTSTDFYWDTSRSDGIVRRSELGDYKPKQTAKASPAASGTTYQFIDTISQDTNGVITATKKSVRAATTAQTGIVQLSTSTNSTSTTLAATPSAVKAVRDELDSLSGDVGLQGDRLQAVESAIDDKADAMRYTPSGYELAADLHPVFYATTAAPTDTQIAYETYVVSNSTYLTLYDAANDTAIAHFYLDGLAYNEPALPITYQVAYFNNQNNVPIHGSFPVLSAVATATSVAYMDDVADAAAASTNYTDAATNRLAYTTLEYIESPETARGTVYTGVSRDTELRDGKMILYRLQAQPTAAWTLNLTLADGSQTGPLATWYTPTGRITAHYVANAIVALIYRNGAWYAAADYNTDANYYDRNLVTYCKAAEAIPANVLAVGTTNGYYKLAAGRTFDLDRPILYCNGAQTVGKTNGNNWYAYCNGVNLATTLAGWAGDATTRGKPVYLLGSVNDADRTFTIDAETPFSLDCIPPCICLGWYNANANSAFEFMPGELIRDDIPTKQWVDDEITIRLTTTNAYISVSNGVQRIYEIDGTNRTLKWEWDMNFAAISNQVNSLVTQMLRKIEDPHAWADYAASGIANPFPGAVALDRGSTYFGSTNVTWTANNGFAVMTSHLPATASGNASQFRIGVDADDWFGMEVTASYLVDAHSDSFRVVDGANNTKTATITTDYDASYVSVPPVVYYSASLAEPFAQLDSGVTWSHNSTTHVSTVTIQGLTASAGFFFLKKWEAGGAIFRSTMPILPEGYRVEDTSANYIGTVQPDSIITITQGGKTYRLIAEEVQ